MLSNIKNPYFHFDEYEPDKNGVNVEQERHLAFEVARKQFEALLKVDGDLVGAVDDALASLAAVYVSRGKLKWDDVKNADESQINEIYAIRQGLLSKLAPHLADKERERIAFTEKHIIFETLSAELPVSVYQAIKKILKEKGVELYGQALQGGKHE